MYPRLPIFALEMTDVHLRKNAHLGSILTETLGSISMESWRFCPKVSPKKDDAESIESEMILKITVAPLQSVNSTNGLDLTKPIAMVTHRAITACFLTQSLRKFGRRDTVPLSGGFR